MSDDKEERRHTDRELLEMIKSLDKDVASIYEILHSEAYLKRTVYLDKLIERENSRAALRKAIIEKTLSSLIWSMLVAATYAIYHTFFAGK